MPRTEPEHVPVLQNEVLGYLNPQAGDAYLDLTAGYGGHAAAVLERTANPKGAVLVDRDIYAVQRLKKRFGNVRVEHSDFLRASRELLAQNQKFDLILADLGVSSPQLDRQERGFSFSEDSPLDMRMDQTQELSADKIVNSWSEESLANILAKLGEEPKARQIARQIVTARPIKSTKELTTIIARAWPGKSRRHPATRSFQAIRLAVNDELGQLESALPLWLELLRPGGRLGVISFHSLEDRVVKQFLLDHTGGYDAEIEILTPKPVVASATDTVHNPRARSAKLRVARAK